MHRALVLLLALVLPVFAQDVRITEFMPANTAGIQDQDGTFQPWIEIWNANLANNGKVNLTNWRLSHAGTNWTFPAGMEIPPGEYLVVFASGKNRLTMTAPLHTNFTLNAAGGGPLQLLRPDSSVASSYTTYPALPPNVSYGRDRVEVGQIGAYTSPTPGDTNNYSGTGVSGKVAISLSSRAFTGSLSVSLSQVSPAANAVIRYTTDRSVPTSFSQLYNGTPLNVTTTSVIRARVFEPGKLPGETETSGYLLLDGTTQNFSSPTPIIVVSNFGLGTFPDTGDQQSFMWVWEPGADGRSRFTDLPTLATRSVVDRRGSSTIGNAKTNFNLEARKSRDDDDRDIPLLGLGEGSDWVFHAPYSFDRSLMHNPFMYALSNAIGRAAMRSRMAEVFVEVSGFGLNFTNSASGDYYGVYNVMQKIRRGQDRIDIEDLDPYENDNLNKQGGYIFKVDRIDTADGDSGFSAGGTTLAYYYPKETEMKSPMRDPQEQYLTSYINSFKAALDSANFKDPVTGYAAWLDVPAALDHHLLNTWAFNVDALRLSGYIHKDIGTKLIYGPIWDFDRALSSTDGRDANPAVWRSQTGDLGTDFFNYAPWWNKLFTDPDFYQKYIDRWVVLRAREFSSASVNALLDALNAEITAEAVRRDFTRWTQAKRAWTSPFTGINYPAPSNDAAIGQTAEVQRIKDYLQQRANFFDSQWVAPVTFTSGGNNYNAGGTIAAGSTVTLTAAAGSTIYYTLDGTDPRPSGGLAPTSPSAIAYSGPITVNDITRIKARAYNPNWIPSTQGQPGSPPLVSKWSGLRDVRLTLSPLASAGSLAVTEVNYHPTDPTAEELLIDPTFESSDFEFIELKNIATTPIDLAGVRVKVGAEYVFTNDVSIILQPGEYVLISGKPAALAARYGNLANVVGAFAGDLNNAGEQIQILTSTGAVIADFTYDDVWYNSTDGNGRSLEGLNQAQLSQASGWRASLRIGGSPGFEDIAVTYSDHPDDATRNPGQPVTFEVAVSGFPAPTLQWRKDGEVIEGATSATYTIAAVTEADEAIYDVVASNYSGPVLSNPATLSVNDPVLITVGPESKTVNPGTEVTLTVTATGTGPFTYQWRKDTNPIGGATNPSLVINAAEGDEGSYDVVITNVVNSATSDPATLSVNDPVQITTSPESQTVNPGNSVTFNVAASGTGPFSYQWRKGGSPIAEATGAELTINPVSEADQGSYDVVVSNVVGPMPSAEAVLTVNDPVQFADGPDDQTVNPGDPVTFSVSVTGTGPFQYQWRKGGVAIEGAVNAEYTIAAVTEENEGTYDVVVTNVTGPATSGAATLTVNDPIQFVAHPQDRSVASGGQATFSVTVTGSGPFTYQWRRNNVAISGATGATHVIPSVGPQDLGSYDVVVGNGIGEATSNAATLTFLDWNAAATRYQGSLERDSATDPALIRFPGRVTAALTKTGKLTGKLEYFGLSHAFKVQLDANLHAEVTLPRRELSFVTLTFDLDGVEETLQVSVAHTDGSGAYAARAEAARIPKRLRTSPAPLAGQYTVLLEPGPESPEELEESGYLSVKIAPSGTTSWVGKLPDTTNVRGSALLAPGDEVAFYSPLYVPKGNLAGHIAGPLAVDANGIAGTVTWRKPPQLKGDFWRAGLTTELNVVGSRWVLPARGVPPIAPGAKTFRLENSSESTDDFPVQFTSAGKFVPQGALNKLKLNLNRKTGVLTGSYFDGKSRKVNGVILQNEGNGEGFAPGTGKVHRWQLVAPPQ